MAAKNNTEVIIDGKVYTLSGYESQEYLQKVATYINDKIAEFKMLDEYKRIPSDMRSTLLALNIADDYFKAKNQVEKLEQDLEVKDREIYDLKHELISNQIRMESDAKSLKDLEKENKELLLNKTRLEATLEDALLGKVDKLEGMKENVICGHLIPAGTGQREFEKIIVGSKEEYDRILANKKTVLDYNEVE